MSCDSKTYWRSLEALADDPRARDFLEREFPEGITEPPSGVSRRTMLGLIGASLSLAGLTACRRPEERIVPYVTAPEDSLPGIPLRYATTMPFGTSALGLVVTSHEGRPTKIEGNELHPATLGCSSAWLQASLLDLYDPDRSQGPARPGAAHAEVAGEHGKAVAGPTWEEFVAAWTEKAAAFDASGGQGLALLTGSFASPTLARLTDAFQQRFPQARRATWEPISDENVVEGLRRVTDKAYLPAYHFQNAKTVVALDHDFLMTDREAVRHGRGLADARRVRRTSDEMGRLYVAEAALSVTGSNADHRLRIRAGQIPALLSLLATELHGQGVALDSPGHRVADGIPGVDPEWIRAAAHDLAAHRGEALVLAGPSQPPAVHAAVFAINEALGGIGNTVTYHEPRDAALSSTRELSELAAAIGNGEVDTLIVFGTNPAHDAPADLELASKLDRVETVIHFGTHRDETAAHAAWHLPRAHYLESWGDARALGGTLSVIQPLIAPLWGGKSDVELLSLLATGEEKPGLELVRETWAARIGDADFERRFERVLHDGLLVDSADEPVAPRSRGSVFAGLSATNPSGLEVLFRPSPTIYDGRWANNGWLQELPDPMTKITWDNAALVSPATAASLGLGNGRVASLDHDGRQIELPVWQVPGMADDTVQLTLGYGRTAAGRIGTGVGTNVSALRTTAAPDLALGVSMTDAGRDYPIATTQDHGTMAGRALVREATLARFREEPTFARDAVVHPPLVSPFPDYDYSKGYQWGMSIDLNACNGCNACVIACQSENNIPVVGKDQVARGREMHWLRVDRYFSGPVIDAAIDKAIHPDRVRDIRSVKDNIPLAAEDPQVVFQPVPCMHCENAPCEQVCPVAATVHDSEGLNVMVYNRCIGTRYCSNNCPYKVRRFNYYNLTKDTPEVMTLANNPDVTVRSRGVMEKCTYCTQRINATKFQAKLEGRSVADGELQTACQQACPAQAISFGNINDPDSVVSRRKHEERDYAMLAELNNRPRTTYGAKLRNPNPELQPHVPAADDAGRQEEGH